GGACVDVADAGIGCECSCTLGVGRQHTGGGQFGAMAAKLAHVAGKVAVALGALAVVCLLGHFGVWRSPCAGGKVAVARHPSAGSLAACIATGVRALLGVLSSCFLPRSQRNVLC